MHDAKDNNKCKTSKLVTSMVIEGEDMRCKAQIQHGEDAISLAFMSMREIYEKLINKKCKREMCKISSRSEREMKEGDLEEIRN